MIGRHAHTKKSYIHCVGLLPCARLGSHCHGGSRGEASPPSATCRASDFTRAYRSIAEYPGPRAAVLGEGGVEREGGMTLRKKKNTDNQVACSPASLKTSGLLGLPKSAGFCLQMLCCRRTARESTIATTPMSCPIINLPKCEAVYPTAARARAAERGLQKRCSVT